MSVFLKAPVGRRSLFGKSITLTGGVAPGSRIHGRPDPAAADHRASMRCLTSDVEGR
jgi:hypothetical protein